MNRRAFLAIFRQTFGKKGSGGAKASKPVFVTCLLFVLVLVFVAVNLMLSPYIARLNAYKGYMNVIVVNMPDSAREYIEQESPDLLPLLVTYEHDAEFDFTYYSHLMKENKAFMTIVFPEDFDQAVELHSMPEIHTFVLTDKLKYVSWRETVLDEPLWFYQNFLKDRAGVCVPVNDSIVLYDVPLDVRGSVSDAEYVAGFFARTMIPLITFIGALYICMSKGTNSISWQKENGVFTGILMTPIKPVTIVTGNLAGICLSAFLPALVCYPFLFLIPFYRNPAGPLEAFIFLITLTLFISSVTLMISIMNDTVVAAQTAFLPIFFILLSVCVMCIQNVGSAPDIYYALPVYGHFYGLGNALMGDGVPLISMVICILSTLFMSGICIFTSVKLLGNERFTATVESYSDKEARKARKLIERQAKDYLAVPKARIFGYTPKKRTDHSAFIADQVFFPLAVLSLFQGLAMIPALIILSRTKGFSDAVTGLRDVSTVWGVTQKAFEFFGLLMRQPVYIICMILGYILIISTYIIRIRFREKNSISTIGLTGGNALKSYLSGLLIGFMMISSVYLLLLCTGNVSVLRIGISSDMIPLFIAYILMWIPQGASEEIMFRGFMIPRQAARYKTPFAVFFSSLLFALFHAGNRGFTVLALINLMLISFAFALIALYKENIWTVCAAHTVWNFSQGNLYGLEVSGNASGASVIHSVYRHSASAFITGGDFGPEGGIFVTLVSLAVIAAFSVLLWKKHRKA